MTLLADENHGATWSTNKSTSRLGSPTPMPQHTSRLPPMSPMPMNLRSQSRASSRGYDYPGTPLGSPMPMYPRRRSVTFVDPEERGLSGLREERPFYHTSVEEFRHNSVAPVTVADVTDVSADVRVPPRSLPGTPRKVLLTPTRRSASRQRLENRRQQAVLQHTFYDDSFVEDFVCTAKDELERKVAAERQAEQAAVQSAIQSQRAVMMVNEPSQPSLLSMANTTIPSVSSIGHQDVSSNDSRAILARLLKEFSALEGSKTFVDEPSRTLPPSEHASGTQKQREASIMIIPQSYRDASLETNRNAHSMQRHGSKEARIESIIREAVVSYRNNKKAGSVMVIDLSDMDAADEVPHRPAQQTATKKGKSAAKNVSNAPEESAAVLQRKRHRTEDTIVPRTVAPPGSRKRVDSRPQLDDSSDDEAAVDDELSTDRHVLLPRTSRTIAAQRSYSRRIEQDVDTILSSKPTVSAKNVLPRAPPPPPPRSRGQGRGRAKMAQSEVEQEASQPRHVATTTPFAAPYIEPTLTRETHRPAPRSKASDKDPFAHFFDLQFDSPSKFDEGLESQGVSRRGNVGLTLATTCRSRRK